MAGDEQGWRRCSACKKPIGFGATYWVCNVSTCNRKRTGLAFCSVTCWEVHLPVARHRESWAVERTSPTRQQWEKEKSAAATPPRQAGSLRRAREPSPPAPAPRARPAQPMPESASDDEILIIASRLKSYVRARSGMNTSDRALRPLSEIVRKVCDRAIRNAAEAGRKTVLDRDVPRS